MSGSFSWRRGEERAKSGPEVIDFYSESNPGQPVAQWGEDRVSQTAAISHFHSQWSKFVQQQQWLNSHHQEIQLMRANCSSAKHNKLLHQMPTYFHPSARVNRKLTRAYTLIFDRCESLCVLLPGAWCIAAINNNKVSAREPFTLSFSCKTTAQLAAFKVPRARGTSQPNSIVVLPLFLVKLTKRPALTIFLDIWISSASLWSQCASPLAR